ncbi:MAG: RNA polymerase sigma factor [Actinomycetota bacterium]
MSRELLEACRRGDPEAFKELVALTSRQVYTLAYRLVGDRHEAEDVAQEAYVRVYRSLRGFRGESRFETWLHRVVANAALNYMRSRNRFGEPIEVPEVEARAPDAPPIEHDEVKEALAALPTGQRAVVVLKDIYGFSCQEIGEQMGLSEGAVKVRLHRARRRLRDMIYGARASEGHEEIRSRLPEYAEEAHGRA